ncbi:MAG TPA: ABC transporter substrate-binding protein [Candidatus Limivivens intestinipullorum]|uniref:ABC transporter substrate-binding protein n=1 Tax=Candidatus Limivivens intestinipullorum TaxID=2840858 RepID=A0A9D1EQU8_9FIRM|nr:ABC transporter substrate-binding protein [Candidatus Limivivens intestinipullorum]
MQGKNVIRWMAAAAAGLCLCGGMSVWAEEEPIRVGSMTGPTSMGLVKLMEDDSQGTSENDYDFTMVTTADELTALVANNDLDIALVPANVASILYSKTEQGISVIDINTLGVLYMVSGDDSIDSLEALAGKTVYLTGKGTTPDYVLQYLLREAGLEDQVSLEYKSEATEVASILAEDSSSIGLLPQPFATTALAQNEELKLVMDLTQVWDETVDPAGSRLVTGVTIVTKDFLEANPEAVDTFLEEHKASAEYTETNPEETAKLIVDAGILANENVAQQALPYCSITCITGEEMQEALSGYLTVLYDMDGTTVGGALPEDDFYYQS